MTSIQGKSGDVHQVYRGTKNKNKDVKQKNEFMPPGTVMALDPKD